MAAQSRVSYGGRHPPRYEKPIWLLAMHQPRFPMSDDPGYWGTALTSKEKKKVAQQVSRGERILPACFEHMDDGPMDHVPRVRILGVNLQVDASECPRTYRTNALAIGAMAGWARMGSSGCSARWMARTGR